MLEIISRSEARARGLARYFTGLECRHGHAAARYVSDWRCVECHVERQCRFRQETPERARAQELKRMEAYPLYHTWRTMKRRCENPNDKDYGGRGIKVCERWRNSYDAFVADMGPKPTPKHSIDRINNDGNYEPSNCRWATMKEQLANRRRAA